jgi:DNA polymerase III subunit epsilon
MTHWSDSLAVFDTETTGLDTRTDRIVTAFVGLIGPGGQVLESQSWLADPGIPIPDRAAEVHGVTTEMARENGRPAREVVTEILDALNGLLGRGCPLVVYNASYDLSMMHFEALRHGLTPLGDPRPVVDPLVVDRALDPYRRGKRTLDAVSAHYGVTNPAAHDAKGDAVTSGLVVQAMVRVFPDQLGQDPGALHDQQIDWAKKWEDNYYDYLERNGKSRPASRGAWPVGRDEA